MSPLRVLEFPGGTEIACFEVQIESELTGLSSELKGCFDLVAQTELAGT